MIKKKRTCSHKYSRPDIPKIPCYGYANDFKAGRHIKHERTVRQWMHQLARSNFDGNGAELETMIDMQGSPNSSTSKPGKNGCYVNRILRNEVGATNDHTKDFTARKLLAHRLLPPIRGFGCSTAEELAYGSTRNFKAEWVTKPGCLPNIAAHQDAANEVRIRVEYHSLVKRDIETSTKAWNHVIEKLASALQLTFSSNMLLAEADEAFEILNGDRMPGLQMEAFDFLERLKQFQLLAPVRPPAYLFNLINDPENLQGVRGPADQHSVQDLT